MFDPLIRAVLGEDRRFTPHCLRHTWASLHLARGTPITWIKEQGGWASAKMLLDVYGPYVPEERRGFSDALSSARETEPDQTSQEGRA